MKKGDYYKWKEGEKLFKAPWVIELYKNITDENQYDKSHIVTNRAIYITGLFLFLYGLGNGLIIGIFFL